ncbi:MAG: ribosomal protein S18-alanine N-acetyltransferase [Candidatus Bathyarchaeota archaeon]|nr:ribosomal protein S18-alanine N-acetyltransferase [Candidatus Bathyarchaeota archaeon]
MQNTFRLRGFQIEDLRRVTEINRECLPENYTDFFFIDLFRRFPEAFIVAEEDGKIIGYIMCRVEVGLSNFGLGGLVRKGHIVSVAVVPEHRRKGVAEAIVEKATENMKTRYGAKQCYLEVRVTNEPAISLYKKLGFEVIRTINGYYADGEDAYLMSKRL